MTDIPKNSPWGRELEAQRDKQGLWERLFGSRDESVNHGRRGACIVTERGRER